MADIFVERRKGGYVALREQAIIASGHTQEWAASRTEQWTIDPLDGEARGVAFVWDSFDVPGQMQPMLACCQCTVPASALIRSIMPNEPDPRMPAILQNADWATWLGETDAVPDAAKSVLRTMEGVDWEIRREAKPRPFRSERSAPSDMGPGLF